MAYLCMLTHCYDENWKSKCMSVSVHTDPVIINNSKLSYINTEGNDVLVLYSGTRENLHSMIDVHLERIGCKEWYAAIQRKKLQGEIYE